MIDFETIALVVTLTAGLAYLNARFLRLPSTIGLMAIALLGSLALLGLLVARPARYPVYACHARESSR